MQTSPVQSGHGGSVEVTFKDDIAIVTMKRGENRVNREFDEQLQQALDEVLRNPRARALVTTGDGKFYSNGLDLAWLLHLQREDPDRLKEFVMSGTLGAGLSRILTFPLPTIALINGHAYAAGALFALAHDHVIMSNQRGWWCLNEVHNKMHIRSAMKELCKLKLPSGTLHEATSLGRRYTANEAKSAGIVHEVCHPTNMYSSALAWVKKIVPPNGFDRQHLQTMKEDIYDSIIAQKSAGVDVGFLPSHL